jgi:5-methylcytosine-specific restriction endonuclease McrA
MAVDWGSIFDNFGIKKVTKTDKSKSAYVLNKPQLAAVEAAGLKPSDERPAQQFDITLLFDARPSVKATYYHALRDEEGRPPEPRLGTELISTWLERGESVVIGNIGSQLYAAKIPSADISSVEAAEAAARKASPKNRQALIDRAKKSKGKPATKQTVRNDFVRDPAVVMGAVARAGGKCEMPGCTCELFNREDGSPFLEVHHVEWLAKGGVDELENAAALCPRCHRELHFGAKRDELQKALRQHIKSLI